MTFQQEVLKEYESQGYLVLKTIRLNKTGYPDLMCLKRGQTIWIECKEANDNLKPLQEKRIDKLRQMGFTAFAIQKGKGIIY